MRLRLLIFALLVGWAAGCAPPPQRPPSGTTAAPTAGTTTEHWMFIGDPWCERGCLGYVEWNQLVPDRRLRHPLAILYQHVPEFRPQLQTATQRRVAVTAARLTDAAAHYNPTTNTVVLGQGLLSEPPSIVASVLAHELSHSVFDPSGTRHQNLREGATSCLEDEMLAFAWEAATWQRVKRGTERSGWVGTLDDIVRAWQGKTMAQYVIGYPDYQRHCFGRALRFN